MDNKEKLFMKTRERDTHKGDYGKVLVVAGSKGMAGAAALCGKAVLRAGAGLVRFAVPEELFSILQISVPEATCIQRDFDEAINVHDYEAIALGSGLGIYKENIKLIKRILNEYTGKLVLDADGLNCVMRYTLYGNLIQSNAQIILTPHTGEARRLLEVEKIKNRKEAALEIAESFKANVVMKGATTLVVNKEADEIFENTTGNPGMATGGSGDVLTGVVAGIAAQGYSCFEAAKLGVYIHGLSGDISAAEIGETSMTAVDILNNLHKAFKKVKEEK